MAFRNDENKCHAQQEPPRKITARAKKHAVLRRRRAKNPRHPLSPVLPAKLVSNAGKEQELMVAVSALTAHRKLISARADVSVPRRGHQEDAGDGGETMVDGDQLGRHGFRLYGHGEIRDGGCCCCRHGNSNTLFCF